MGVGEVTPATLAAVLAGLLAVSVTGGGPVDVTTGELIANGANWADRLVLVQGELVGDYGRRADGSVWAQLNGDAYASGPIGAGGQPVGGNAGIGVVLSAEIADGLDPPGRYLTSGPLVEVAGIWRWHDGDRMGESYLDAAVLHVIRPGRRYEEGPDWTIVTIGAVLVAIVPLLWPWRAYPRGWVDRRA